MGSQKKARELLEVSDTLTHYSNLISYSLMYFIAKAQQEGSPLADELLKIKNGYQGEFDDAAEITGQVVSEVFSDEELDELIVLNTNPSLEKLRGLTPEIMKRVLEKYSVAST
ncbi:MAG: hypothetical protein HQ553_09870 [Chloroflexi bacterium]|nr:hypothetical protein [Chloroflexota bacterium]